MAAQPLNSAISVYLAVRSYRNSRRHDSIEGITKKLRPLVVSVPGEEVLTKVAAYDTTKRDYSSYGRNGFPIVIAPVTDVSFGTAQETVANVDFGFTIGNDQFLPQVAAGLDDDAYAAFQALN